MLTRREADVLATQILHQAQKESDARKDALAPGVSWVYRCPELKALSPWQQARVLILAKEEVSQSKLNRAFVGVMIVGLLLVFAVTWLWEKRLPAWLLIAYSLPISALRIFWIRRSVKQRAQKQVTERPR